MAGNRPVDRIRDSGGSFKVGDVGDGTPVREFIVMSDHLHVVTDRAIYQIKLADQIDPDRLNAAIPHNVHRQLLGVGFQNELVRRILFTAKELFDGKFLEASVDHEAALSFAFDMLENVVAMSDLSADLETAQAKAVADFEARRQSGGSMMLPSIGDVRLRAKAFIQKADHAGQALHDIAKLFFGLKGRKGWSGFSDLLAETYGGDDAFAMEMARAAPFLGLVRNTRDCLEHKNVKGVTVSDFELDATGTIAPPSISIDFRDTKEPLIALSLFFDQVTQSMVNAAELIFAYLCSKRTKSVAGLPVQVIELDDPLRTAKGVRFGYGALFNGQLTPIG